MKTFGLVMLSILLFILLAGFGLAFSVNQIALSPGFVTGVINDIDFSQTARDAIDYERIQNPDEDFPQELVDAIIATLDEIEPVLKENAGTAIHDIYSYVLGRANAPDLKETLGNSFMNAEFVDALLAKIDLSHIVNEAIKEQTTSGDGTEDALQDSLLAAVDDLEPALKEGVVLSSGPIFQYVLGNTQTINLKNVLRQNLLNKEFVTELFRVIDIGPVASDVVNDQLDMVLPQGIVLNSNEIDQIVAAAEPTIKASLISAADPIADYLLGLRTSFSLTIRWDNAATSTKPIVKQAFLRQLPPALATATPAQIDQAFETYWISAQNSIPTTFTFDTSMLGNDLPQSIDDALTSAQDGLTDARNSLNEASLDLEEGLNEARPYIGWFRLSFWGLILLILLIIGCIVLIHRTVRGSTLNLGIIFLVYGVIELIGVLIIRTVIGSMEFINRFIEGDIPEYIFNIISPIMQRLTQPLLIFTIVCTIIGIALLVLYFVYPKMRPRVETTQSPPQS